MFQHTITQSTVSVPMKHRDAYPHVWQTILTVVIILWRAELWISLWTKISL